MMNLLAIDTATDMFSVAVGSFSEKAIGDIEEGRNLPRRTRRTRSFEEGDTWLFEADVGLRHSELSMDSIDMILRRADIKPEDLNGVVCMGGPGSFTGLRIGFSLAKGLALSLNIPFAAIPTLDCMAWPFSSLPGIVVPVIDAKKGAYFCALYQNGKKLSEDMDATPGEIAAVIASEKATIFGPGASLLYEQLCAMNLQDGVIWGKNLRWGNAMTLLQIAWESGIIRQGGNEYSAGPKYIRTSC